MVWSSEFYDDLQNRVGGGKPKMRDYFGVCSQYSRNATCLLSLTALNHDGSGEPRCADCSGA